jgi:RimJ/RimL family protein N-acetyltransferase
MQNEIDKKLGVTVNEWVSRQVPPYTKIVGKYCVLEPLNIDLHATALFTAFLHNNESGETWQYLPFGPFATLGDFKHGLKIISSDKIMFTIINLQTNIPEASYMDVDPTHGSIEVGAIHYSKQLQKTQAATEAMYLMMHRVFAELGYRRYQWRCNALNQGSRLAAQRLGFKFEGIFRQHYVFKGRNRDTAWFSILDSEWSELKLKFEKWLSPDNFDLHGKQILKLRDC